MRRALLAALVVAASITTAYSQEVRATITGLVTDPSGAPVASALVRVTNIASNVVVTAKSNESGNYATAFLNPGSYQLEVEATGFKKFVRQNIVLQSQDKARVDVPLEVGELTQSVMVVDAVSLLQTETASRAQVIENEMIKEVPTMGRNPFQIAWAAPGVVKSGSWRYLRSLDIGGTSGISINGGREKQNEVLLDGISNVQSDRTVMSVPTMDSVQEFKIQSNTYDAQYGRTGGGIITIVTKGGGNAFHGTAFEYLQADNLNANQWELNRAGTKRPGMAINTFGVQASGPIVIPKVVDARNRLFWMVSYEGLRHHTADPGVATFPLMEWRNGDFSSLYNAQGSPVLVYDPLTTKADGSRTPFAGNQIPGNRINAVAKKLMSYYPSPNSLGDNPAHTNNYTYPSIWFAGMDQWVGRLDAVINSRNNFFFRYGENPYNEYRSIVFALNNPAEPSGNAPLLRNARSWTMDWTSTISPRLTFDLRFGLNRYENAGGSLIGMDYDISQLGFDKALTSQFTRQQFPQLSLGTYQGMGSRPPDFSTSDVYSIQPNFNMVSGRHFMKFGAEARDYRDQRPSAGQAVGAYTFSKDWTQANASRSDAVSGNELASLLLGYPKDAYVDQNIDPAYKHRYWAMFFNDDWKITNRLTINLGLRWDYEAPITERHDRLVRGLDFTAASPIASQVSGLNLKGTMLFAGIGGQPTGSFEADKNNFQPRIGAAYRLTNKWVLRGGYGLYYLGQNEYGAPQGFSQRSSAITSTDGLTPAVNLTNAFTLLPNGRLLSAVGSSKGAASFLGESISPNYLNRPLPYSHQYSFDIQRELPGNMMVEVAYVGNQTRKLPVNFNLNYVPAGQLNRRTASGAIDSAYYTERIANPMAGLIPNNASLNGATIQRQLLLYAYPQFAQVTLNNVPIGKQRYDSVQMKVTKRFESGLTLLGSYTIAKTLEQVSTLNAQDFNLSDINAIPLVKQSAWQIDAPQKFNLTWVWELPFGKGKRYGGSMNRALDLVLGGWQVSGDVTYMSGWTPNYPNANQTSTGSAVLDNATPLNYFNTSLWNDPATGKRVGKQDQYVLRDYPTRFGDLRVPGYQNWDVNLSKYFTIHEQTRLQFRSEFINMMNHPWFSDMATNPPDVTSATFGQLNLTQKNLPRFIKMALQLYW